jgi:uncharacterized membrane protein
MRSAATPGRGLRLHLEEQGKETTMSSPASIKNHPIHPILVAFPIGLWVFALVCDAVRLAGAGPAWSTVAMYCVAGGIAGAILAAVPGLMDYFSIDDAEMGQIATLHLWLNLGAIVLFALNFWSRFHFADGKLPFFLSLAGVVLIGFGGWLGGEMVYVKGMAVQAVEKSAQRERKRPIRRAS